MFARPTDRRASGRKNHDRGHAETGTPDLTTITALRRALQDADITAIARESLCNANNLRNFASGRCPRLPAGSTGRVRQALLDFDAARKAEKMEAAMALAAPRPPAPKPTDILPGDPDWLVSALKARALRADGPQ